MGAGETSRHAETVLWGNRRGGERSDVEEDDDSGGGLEFLQEVDEDQGSTVWTACLVEENANASESADGCTSHTGREA